MSLPNPSVAEKVAAALPSIMSNKKCRWGFLSSAWIGMKNWQSVALSGNGEIVAVASRDQAKAQAWIDECSGHVPFPSKPEAVEGYDALLAREDIDAVYIPLPTGVRTEWIIKAAKAGKHVLAEKPCGINVVEVEEIIAACNEAGVQFMDGVMFMHSKRLDALRETLTGGSIGELRRITSAFSFNAGEDFLAGNIRMHSDLEPLGCLGDLGWYNIRFNLWVMDYAMPKAVSGRILRGAGRADSPDQVPMEFSGEMFYENGVNASYYCSFLTGNQQWAHICGTEGTVRLDDFVVPFYGSEVKYTVSNTESNQHVCDFNMEQHDRVVPVREYGGSHPTAQETGLFRNFGELALSGQPDPKWGEIALKTQQVLMACIESSKQDGARVEL
jgi:predicted dehydrogenase